MQSSLFARWAQGHHVESHVVLPALISLLLMAMYFSGSRLLQNIVAPSLDGVPLFSSREFGALEMLQNFFLLCIVFYSARCLLAAGDVWIRMVALLLVFISVFTLLEEIDYGAHYIEYFTGQYGSLAQETWDRNWHNRTSAAGVQNVSYLKLAGNVAMLGGFVLAPLLLSKVRNRTIRLLTPSKWMIATVLVTELLSLLTHSLERAGFATIGGSPGTLYKNLSEFGELNMYYLFLLYTAILHDRLIARNGAPERITGKSR